MRNSWTWILGSAATFAAIALLGYTSFLWSVNAWAAEPAAKPSSVDARQVLDRIDDLWRGKQSESLMQMNIKTKHWKRSLTMKAYSEGKEKTLVKVLKPLKEKNTATLKNGTEIYNYLPKTDRTIKLSSAMMMGNWLGSHFTNDDLVKESRYAEDYSYSISFDGERNGKNIVELTLLPKPDAAVVWGKLLITVNRADMTPLAIRYFDEDGSEKRVMHFSEVKQLPDRVLPMVLRMEPTDKPGEFTEIRYKSITFDVKLPDGFFSIRQLKR